MYALTIIYHDGTESHHKVSVPPKIVPDEQVIQFMELIEPAEPETPRRTRTWLMPMGSFKAAFFEGVKA